MVLAVAEKLAGHTGGGVVVGFAGFAAVDSTDLDGSGTQTVAVDCQEWTVVVVEDTRSFGAVVVAIRYCYYLTNSYCCADCCYC